jgi:hypothetical protein
MRFGPTLLAGVQGAQTALLGPLKEVLESMTGGYEVMKEVVAALQDTERGKTASMTVLLQELQERQASKPSREEQERLRLEVRHRSCCQSIRFSGLHIAHMHRCIGLLPRGAAGGCQSMWRNCWLPLAGAEQYPKSQQNQRTSSC